MDIEARETVTFPSSTGCLKSSSTRLLNSGSSSRNKTPWWARLISPGLGIRPPPINPASEIVWWGARKGLSPTTPLPFKSPETLKICVTSIISSKVRGGSMVGNLRASIVFPAPGGPIKRTLWEPAAATSKARLTCCCPLISWKSTSYSGRGKSFRKEYLQGEILSASLSSSTTWTKFSRP